MARVMQSESVMRTDGVLFTVLSSLFITFTSLINWLFLHLYCRLEVLGRENVPHRRGVMLVSNHQSMIDSFMLTGVAYFPWVLFRMSLAPWHPAAIENFFHKRLLRFCTWLWRCIPVRRRQHDFGAVWRMVNCRKGGSGSRLSILLRETRMHLKLGHLVLL